VDLNHFTSTQTNTYGFCQALLKQLSKGKVGFRCQMYGSFRESRMHLQAKSNLKSLGSDFSLLSGESILTDTLEKQFY
jgi:hypothetical protein